MIIVAIEQTTVKMFQRLKSWLKNRRHFIFSWYTKDAQETQEPEKSLLELPTAIQKQLVDAIENLPNNPADIEAVASTLDEAFDLWREDPNNADNSIVVLSSPITAASRILSETLAEWTKQKQLSMKLLSLTARPERIETIKEKLEHYLAEKSSENDPGEVEPEIMVIPNLSWCFLRSLEGLEGIEYLQKLLCEGSKNRFWIIGGGQVGWQYLNSVCTLEAYCGRVFTLPALAPEKLQEWLDPIVHRFDLTFDEPRIDQQILEGDRDNKAHYFDLLADISQGVGTVAIQMFLKSICCQEDKGDEKEKEDQTQPQERILVAQTPQLAKLPTLESLDQYLLYSLLLHGDLTLSALAESLGDSNEEVQARVQLLRRQGVVEQRDRVLKINPIYYPQLKNKLASNNFIINKE